MRDILLVEDCESDAALMNRCLRAAKVINRVRHLTDGAQAFAFLKNRENTSPVALVDVPSVLLLDLKLPKASGFELLGYIQMHPAFNDILKVVVSDLTNMQDIRTAYGMGAQSFLNKPVNLEDLRELIATYPEYWSLG
jgi:CheY-like chemotaxis protein